MATPEVYRNFESQIKNLENAGAKIISIEVPEVQLINVGHIGTCFKIKCNKKILNFKKITINLLLNKIIS